MKIAMKQRLVGTVVIGCLVIIFVPILLDGEGVSPPAMTVSSPAAPPMPVEPDVEPTRPAIEPDTLPATTASSETDYIAVESAGDEPPPAPDRPRLDPAGIPETWTVRLGSFGERANADGLVSRLKDKGYKAFTRPLQTSRGSLTGVYVGPVLTEREAGELQQALAGAFELEGVVVQFSIDELGN